MSKELFNGLQELGLLEFGEFIPVAVVHELLGIEMPAQASKEVFDAIALKELGAIDYVRTILLNEGKYIAGSPGGYRILLPSENQAQVELYMKSADRKLKRAGKLSRNTPRADSQPVSNTGIRAFLKQAARRNQQTPATA
jgi:hypothetical protein